MVLRNQPDGSAVFMCGRASDRPDEHDRLARWIGEEAVAQGRCPLCLRPRAECPDVATCDREPVGTAAAVAILRGMVAG